MNRREAISLMSGALLTPYIPFPFQTENIPKFTRIDLTNTNEVHAYSSCGNLSFYKYRNIVGLFRNSKNPVYIPISKEKFSKIDFVKNTEKSMKTLNIDYFEIINGDESNLFALGY